ncbi:hypothetical protein INR49_018770 [Caranx melampygus]|nr:hypothetical protein INR49_018770 [Caranx melampygus]
MQSLSPSPKSAIFLSLELKFFTTSTTHSRSCFSCMPMLWMSALTDDPSTWLARGAEGLSIWSFTRLWRVESWSFFQPPGLHSGAVRPLWSHSWSSLSSWRMAFTADVRASGLNSPRLTDRLFSRPPSNTLIATLALATVFVDVCYRSEAPPPSGSRVNHRWRPEPGLRPDLWGLWGRASSTRRHPGESSCRCSSARSPNGSASLSRQRDGNNRLKKTLTSLWRQYDKKYLSRKNKKGKQQRSVKHMAPERTVCVSSRSIKH